MANRFSQPTAMDVILNNTTKAIQQPQSSTGAYKPASNPKTVTTNGTNPQMQSMVNHLQSHLVPVLSMYCKDFTGKYGKNMDVLYAAVTQFAERLYKAGITKARLKIGIERLKQRSAETPWAPTPEEFVSLCKPSCKEINAPNLTDAILEISRVRRPGRNANRMFSFTHPIVQILNEQIGYQISQKSHDAFTKLAEPIYNRLLKQALDGTLPTPMPALPYKQNDEPPAHLGKYELDPESDLGKRIAIMRQKAKDRQQGIHLKTDRTKLKKHQRPVDTGK